MRRLVVVGEDVDPAKTMAGGKLFSYLLTARLADCGVFPESAEGFLSESGRGEDDPGGRQQSASTKSKRGGKREGAGKKCFSAERGRVTTKKRGK